MGGHFATAARAGLLAAAALLPAAGAARAGDAQPRDFIPAPAGTHLGLLYYSFSSADTFIDRNGDKVPGSALDVNVGIARYVYFFDVGGMRADINLVQPFGGLSDMRIGGADIPTEDFALGDTSIVATVWPLNDPKNNRYFAIANYITLPTGDYSADEPGLGSNRWSITIQPAYYFSLSPKWSVDLVGDVTIYGDNDDGPGGATVEQDPSWTMLGWLNYHHSATSTFSVGFSKSWIGEQTIGGVGQGDGQVTTVRAAWSQMLNPTTQLVVELGTDVDAENTFERDTTALLRIAKFF